jgi:hypothetical protein
MLLCLALGRFTAKRGREEYAQKWLQVSAEESSGDDGFKRCKPEYVFGGLPGCRLNVTDKKLWELSSQ